MSDSSEQIQETTNNQTDSTTEVAVQETGNEPEQVQESTQSDGATSETGDTQEFADENMQKKFTQRMQELSEKEKQYNTAIKRAEAFDQLARDKDFVDWYNKRTGKVKEEPQPEVMPDISDEEYDAIQSDRTKFQTILDSRAKKAAETMFMPIVNKLQNQIQSMRLEQDINDFATAKDKDGNLMHPDFWQLDETGRLEPYLRALSNSDMTNLQKIEAAYRLSRYDDVSKNAVQKAHNIVEEKKKSITPKGTKQSAALDTSNMSMLEFARHKARELNIDVP